LAQRKLTCIPGVATNILIYTKKNGKLSITVEADMKKTQENLNQAVETETVYMFNVLGGHWSDMQASFLVKLATNADTLC
jgi:hypothetical protein